ncbi:DUF4291 domain-containing protein [Streptomyces sp. NBC_01808]|uniref:DUF4291 domain-containing protein n=1 Tax=Streptomyces sp. NBC_01808 TaxID=2975947 RepID=UPI002DDB9DD4|nr:DUF4291 domain-containing protein [Streptomyces sp. NBC_01808]WSA41748.1 DUF4291 domain-containing protein [Streptomyces sp. NBC_01808]
MTTEARQVRARQTADTVTVYQAYAPAIAEPALRAGTFVPPFKRERMTWIKPSFLWMMYRCGWAEKPGQERVLAVEISRRGFEWALRHSCLSHHDSRMYATRDDWLAAKRTSPVRIQWDPERDMALRPLERRAIQIGLSGPAVGGYVDEWIRGIEDVTPLARDVRALLREQRREEAAALLPREEPCPLPDAVRARIGAT